MNEPTTTDRIKLKAALLNLGRTDYETLRVELIARLGYDAFRSMQNSIFAEIGTLAHERREKSATLKLSGNMVDGTDRDLSGSPTLEGDAQ